jgi:hypothetical protein
MKMTFQEIRIIATGLFLYSYESEFLQKLVKDKKIHEARAFISTYRYIDDVLSINNSRFAEFLPLLYPPEVEVKGTTIQLRPNHLWTYKRGTIRTHWYVDDLLKQCSSKGDKYVIDEELQHTYLLFLGVGCFTFLNFFENYGIIFGHIPRI